MSAKWVCPSCKGAKTQTITGTEITPQGSRELPPVTIDCVTCRGAGVVDDATVKQVARERRMWCTCGDVSDADVRYYADGERKDVRKHHYRHTVCGRVVQVG